MLIHELIKNDRELVTMACAKVVRPVHIFLSKLTAPIPFSLAEALIAFGVLAAIIYLLLAIPRIVKSGNKWAGIYRLLASFLSLSLALYAASGFLWGIYYYGEDFVEQAGLDMSEISVDELEVVTQYFAALANELSDDVPRDETGAYYTDKKAMLERSDEVFLNVEKLFPCLEAPEVKAKGMVFSRIMSYMDFTGFFSAFTAEANLNMDFPPSMFPETLAHELSHQRGVAKEQEANFVSVLACFEYGDAEFCYSAALSAYTYLGNALYAADYERFVPVYQSLNEKVLRDFQVNREYWAQFETPVQTISTEVYDNYLKSYDQTLGMKSYGACVDLLVNYYYEEALEYIATL